jgi:hypothetical protein
MENNLAVFSLVRVVKLLQPIEDYDGWGINQRPPQLDDIGTILDILTVPDLFDRYIVESSSDDGQTIFWLCEFEVDELESM